MVAFPFVLGVLAVGLSLFQDRPDSKGAPGSPIPGRRTAVFAALCVLLCGLFALQTAFTDRAVLTQRPLPPWFLQTLPLQFFAPDPPFNAISNAWLVQWAQILAVMESAVLLAMYAVLRNTDCRSRAVVALVASAVAFLTCVSLRSLVTSVDAYLYIGQALIWPHQYAPPLLRFGGDDAILHEIWGLPILPSAYGPLWTPLVALAISGAHTLGQQMLAVRLLGLGSIALCIACVRQLRGSSAATILFALNPALYERYLIRAHNDLWAVALVLVAAVARRRTWLAIVLVAAAGTIKLPLLLAGLVVFWDKPLLRERLAPACAALALGLAGSLAFGGVQYFHALAAVYAAYDHSPPPLQQAFHLTFAVFALAAIGLALWRRSFLFGLDWSFVSLGQYPLPQYLAWSLPYVLAGNATPVPFLIAWPALDYALSLDFAYTPYFLVERFVLILGVIAAIGYGLLSRRARLPARTTA